MNDMLAAVNFQNPLIWAVLVGWIMSVVLHEFAHGLVAHWGGDYTIRERGGLTLNPLQYIDPIYSIVVPAVILLIGGIPLPGGVTFVRRDLLRSKWWDMAVSLAGPAMNGLIALILIAILSPKVGWADYAVPPGYWSPTERFVAAMAVLQTMAACFNLIPLPPLDGFRVAQHFLPRIVAEKLAEPGIYIICQVLTFAILFNSGIGGVIINRIFLPTLTLFGFTDLSKLWLLQAFQSIFQ